MRRSSAWTEACARNGGAAAAAANKHTCGRDTLRAIISSRGQKCLALFFSESSNKADDNSIRRPDQRGLGLEARPQVVGVEAEVWFEKCSRAQLDNC